MTTSARPQTVASILRREVTCETRSVVDRPPRRTHTPDRHRRRTGFVVRGHDEGSSVWLEWDSHGAERSRERAERAERFAAEATAVLARHGLVVQRSTYPDGEPTLLVTAPG